MVHIALLGDSIFDNISYTRGEPDVVTHLRSLLGSGDVGTLCAVDGAVTRDVVRQIGCVPSDATHLVLSVGGNDALGSYELLNTRVRSAAEALALFAGRAAAFEEHYRDALAHVVRRAREQDARLAVAICTIYNGDLEPVEAPLARTALTIFNDAIVRAGVERAVDIFELRAICCEPADYANPIEPSGRGGLKIARAIAAWATDRSPAASRILLA